MMNNHNQIKITISNSQIMKMLMSPISSNKFDRIQEQAKLTNKWKTKPHKRHRHNSNCRTKIWIWIMWMLRITRWPWCLYKTSIIQCSKCNRCWQWTCTIQWTKLTTASIHNISSNRNYINNKTKWITKFNKLNTIHLNLISLQINNTSSLNWIINFKIRISSLRDIWNLKQTYWINSISKWTLINIPRTIFNNLISI